MTTVNSATGRSERHVLALAHSDLLIELARVMTLVAASPMTEPELSLCARLLESAAIAVKDSQHVATGRSVGKVV